MSNINWQVVIAGHKLQKMSFKKARDIQVARMKEGISSFIMRLR